ncbi:hypothetical protein [Anaerotignum sp.]
MSLSEDPIGFFIGKTAPLFANLSSAFSAFFLQIMQFRQTPFDGVLQHLRAVSRRMEKCRFFPVFQAFFVLRMVLVVRFFLYYNQPKSKEVLHKHSRNYNWRDHFESKYNKSFAGGRQ